MQHPPKTVRLSSRPLFKASVKSGRPYRISATQSERTSHNDWVFPFSRWLKLDAHRGHFHSESEGCKGVFGKQTERRNSDVIAGRGMAQNRTKVKSQRGRGRREAQRVC